MDLFPSSDEGRETLTLLGPLERANLIHRASAKGSNRVGPSPHLRTETGTVSETLFSSI
jgi:hypothetical protein